MAKDTLSFEQLAIKYSEDESKNNGGRIVNPQTGSSSFILEELNFQCHQQLTVLKKVNILSQRFLLVLMVVKVVA